MLPPTDTSWCVLQDALLLALIEKGHFSLVSLRRTQVLLGMCPAGSWADFPFPVDVGLHAVPFYFRILLYF